MKIKNVIAAGALLAIPLLVIAQQYNMSAPQLPNSSLTPGDVLAVTAKDVCVKGYAGDTRDVPQAVKIGVYKSYGITHRETGEYEIDHLISLELGGSNSSKNLWPQSYKTSPWNAHVKDKLEDALHADVCAGRKTLQEAQQAISRDWIAAYKNEFPPKGQTK